MDFISPNLSLSILCILKSLQKNEKSSQPFLIRGDVQFDFIIILLSETIRDYLIFQYKRRLEYPVTVTKEGANL